MGRIIVEVMPKPEILDPQGKAVGSALPRIGVQVFTEIRQGKCFHLSVDGPVTEDALAQARVAAEQVLSNPIIEDVVRVEALPEEEPTPEVAILPQGGAQ
ncbi:MAG: phosphoribosylformylglycinamidine synthase subunit PurS [Actinomycetaceae bacterium]|nr:phosphoribosylformylglycinamidine synthase subunit PurS [Actinomycetaceae bacterium]